MSLKELRNKRGLTQRELARRSGIPHTNIAQFESGKRGVSNMTLQTAIRLADALRVKDLRKLVEP